MGKIAVMTDSNSGITQSQGKELGVYVIPMPFNIGDKTYYEDIDLTQQQFYDMLGDGVDIGTSQPTPENVLNTWDELLKDYDEIVHIPMSSGLSGSCDTARMLSEDYDGRVCVVNNHRISVTQRQSVLDALELAKRGYNARQICDILERERQESSIYIMVDTLKYLKKGGRVTPAAAALGTLLRLKPVLQIQGMKLDAFAKARTVKQARSIMIDAMKDDLKKRIGMSEKGEKVYLEIAHTQNQELAEDFREEILKSFPDHDIYIAPLSLSISCHIGPGALAIACSKMIPELED
ncbi:DegV family protein with EDD domain [Catenibacillus scindens]|uniref:DegV family protein with EDD domain n=1 Tax=Catenibacillus scindens TaxID=673271 RepID=A0A7W8H800_9FIRM|nr:DegV family protein [Catenibacillus scindens]MBB5263428.1 DegV family protein with EDD domain [Catenibacillus scindens]